MLSLNPDLLRPRRRLRSIPLVVGLLAISIGCTANTVEDMAIRRLAIGSWRCDDDAGDDGYVAFVVRVDDDGTFRVKLDAGPSASASATATRIAGTWKVEDGDLDWGFDAPMRTERLKVPAFDDLTLDSTEFTLDDGGTLASSSEGDPSHDIEVKAHGTDAVSFRERGGHRWTCERQ